jgi:AhpD family alkylhydroperoxidase
MKKRLNFVAKGQEAMKPLYQLGAHLKKSTIEKNLQEMIKIRVSQINSCAYCLDMHWKDARALGETEQRLYGLSAWHESPYYKERERAGLLWAEAVKAGVVPDGVYEEAAKQFTEEELIDLTMATCLIDTWNKANIAFPQLAGTYQVGQWG